MNYKQSKKKQRILSITEHDLVIGMDIAKFMHVARAVDFRGIEPTGHYWFPLTEFLSNHQIKLVMVNPFLVNRSKEFVDNSQTKNDYKDAKVIADLIRAGHYTEPTTPNSATFARDSPTSTSKSPTSSTPSPKATTSLPFTRAWKNSSSIKRNSRT